MTPLDLPCHQFVFWRIWGWNHDAAANYARVHLVKSQLRLENSLDIAHAVCVDTAPLSSQQDVSRETECFPRNVKSREIEQNTKQMTQLKVRNAWILWKIGRTNLTSRACSTALLLQRHSTHERSQSRSGWIIELGVTIQLEHRQSRCYELWISDGFERFFDSST